MYDPLETDLSFHYLKEILNLRKNFSIAVMGGWGVFFHVNTEYKKAFGSEYLKSRDIDVFIAAKDARSFKAAIEGLGFEKSAYPFRYELVFDRVKNTLVERSHTKKMDIFNLVYIFLDIFTEKKTDVLGSWNIDLLKEADIVHRDSIPLVDMPTLLKLKVYSFFERDKLDKELKDAADIYALLWYSGHKARSQEAQKAAEKIMHRDDLCEFIAEHVLKDPLKAAFVKQSLRNC